jgi:hypothetical protein
MQTYRSHGWRFIDGYPTTSHLPVLFNPRRRMLVVEPNPLARPNQMNVVAWVRIAAIEKSSDCDRFSLKISIDVARFQYDVSADRRSIENHSNSGC